MQWHQRGNAQGNSRTPESGRACRIPATSPQRPVRAGIRARENLIRRLPKRQEFVAMRPDKLLTAQWPGTSKKRSLWRTHARLPLRGQHRLRKSGPSWALISSPVSRLTRRENTPTSTRYQVPARQSLTDSAPAGTDSIVSIPYAAINTRDALPRPPGAARRPGGFPCRVRPLSHPALSAGKAPFSRFPEREKRA